MIGAPDIGYWGVLFLWLAAGIGLLVLLASVMARGLRRPLARRLVWQASLLGILLMVAAEISGMSNGVTELLRADDSARSPDGSRGSVLRIADGADGKASGVGSPEGAGAAFYDSGAGGEARSDAWTDADGRATTGDENRRGATGDRPDGRADATALPVETRLPGDADAASAGAPNPGAVSLRTWLPGLLWITVALALLLRLLVQRIRLAVVVKRRRVITDGAIVDRVRATASRLRVTRRVRIVRWPAGASPVVCGILRPTLGIPSDFEQRFTPSQQEAILAHELAHVAMRDPFWHFVADVTVSLVWWHPLAYLTRRWQSAASEAAADEASVVVDGGPDHLAECLVLLGARLARPELPGFARVDGGGFRTSLGRRVERLLRLSGRTWRRPGFLGSGVARAIAPWGMVAVILFGTGWARPAASADAGGLPPESGGTQMSLTSVFRKSLLGCSVVALLGTKYATAQRETVQEQRPPQVAAIPDADDLRLPSVAAIPEPDDLRLPQTISVLDPAAACPPQKKITADSLAGEEPKPRKGVTLQCERLVWKPTVRGEKVELEASRIPILAEIPIVGHLFEARAITTPTPPAEKAEGGAPDGPKLLPGALGRLKGLGYVEESLPPDESANAKSVARRVILEARFTSFDVLDELRFGGDISVVGGPEDQWLLSVNNPDGPTREWASKLAKQSDTARLIVLPLEIGQRGEVSFAERTAYIREFEIEQHEHSWVADPVVDTIAEGVLFGVSPRLENDKIRLDFEVEVADLVDLVEKEITLFDGAAPMTIQIPLVVKRNMTHREIIADGGRLILIVSVAGRDSKSPMSVVIELSARLLSDDAPLFIDASPER